MCKKNILNKKGYLKNYKEWNKKIAKKIAKIENIKLNKNHWKIIYIIRNFHKKFKRTPSMLIIHRILKKEKNKINLNKLFKNKFLKISTKISGIPRTNICI
ncbi:TusE/DsrC/DsvC family sulfur relay protein [Buchnera aphidicola (Ceratoglyphina bambusae)]|uniref:TusE/DsrC/DsvC family sulfur relay protein n=1 Tax=Buchnera aphidicola TaxID=9 RepID=UPI0031B86A57